MDTENLEPGKEQHEVFYSHSKRRRLIQYDRRHSNGKLFSCVASDVTTAYGCFLDWCSKNGYTVE